MRVKQIGLVLSLSEDEATELTHYPSLALVLLPIGVLRAFCRGLTASALRATARDAAAHSRNWSGSSITAAGAYQ